jgi:predicted nucleotidyltransferase
MPKTKEEALAKIDELEQLLEGKANEVVHLNEQLRKLAELLGTTNPNPKTIEIANRDTILKVKDLPPEVIRAESNTEESKVIWAIWKLGKPSSLREIQEILIESKKQVSNLSRTLTSLQDKNMVILEGVKKGAKYRFPKNVKVETE